MIFCSLRHRPCSVVLCYSIDHYAADGGGEELFAKIFYQDDSTGIRFRLKNASYLGKKFLAAIFSVIVDFAVYGSATCSMSKQIQ